MVENLFPLKITNASVQKRGKKIIGPIDLTLGEGGFTIILGPNGSGKTTLLRMMHGLEFPRAGTVEWACPQKHAVNRQSFVFQSPIMMRRSLIENLRYPLKIRKVSKVLSTEKATKACVEIGLGEAANLNAQLLSGGEKQKLALARALITDPEVLFLDEPTANLDGKATREIESMLTNALQNGTRIIMATHDLGQAKRLATEVIFLYRGRLHEQGKANAFFKAPKTKEANAYLTGDILE